MKLHMQGRLLHIDLGQKRKKCEINSRFRTRSLNILQKLNLSNLKMKTPIHLEEFNTNGSTLVLLKSHSPKTKKHLYILDENFRYNKKQYGKHLYTLTAMAKHIVRKIRK